MPLPHVFAAGRFRRILVVLMLLAGVPMVCAAAPAWRMLEAPRFTVFSQLSEAKTRAWAEEFNQFSGEVLKMLNVRESALPPLSVVIFARDREFTPYKGLRPDGKGPRLITGLFLRREHWSIIGMDGGSVSEEVRQLIFHESVHWVTSAHPNALPAWLEEGIAELFSTFAKKGDKVFWGEPIDRHILLLRTMQLMPLERMLYLDRTDSLFNEGTRTSIFYAQSWLFVHYIYFGQRSGERSAIDDFLRELRQNSSVDDAFRTAFDGDYRGMERNLTRYLEGGRFFRQEFAATSGGLEQIAVQSAPEHRVEAALAHLAIAPDTMALAERHSRRAIELAPERPEGYEARAAWARAARLTDDTRTACEQAVARGTRNRGTLMLLTEFLLRDAPPGAMTGQAARELANLLHYTIGCAPDTEPAYENLAHVLRDLPKLTQADADAMLAGAKRFPANAEIAFGVAQVVALVGRHSEALEILEKVRTLGLSEESRSLATILEQQWTTRTMRPRIDALLLEGRFAEAIKLCDELLPHLRGTGHYASVMQIRHQATAQSRLQEADLRRGEGRTAEARALYDEAIRSGDLPPERQKEAERKRAELP